MPIMLPSGDVCLCCPIKFFKCLILTFLILSYLFVILIWYIVYYILLCIFYLFPVRQYTTILVYFDTIYLLSTALSCQLFLARFLSPLSFSLVFSLLSASFAGRLIDKQLGAVINIHFNGVLQSLHFNKFLQQTPLQCTKVCTLTEIASCTEPMQCNQCSYLYSRSSLQVTF